MSSDQPPIPTVTFWTQPLSVQVRRTLLWASLIQSPLLLLQCYAVSGIGHGGAGLMVLLPFLALPLIGLPVVCAASLLLLPFRKFRPTVRTLVICGTLYFFIGVILLRLGEPIRNHAFDNLALRSKPLVAAITQFTQDTGSPPTALQDLIPRYLPAIPATGMPAYPNYDYSTESDRWEGNPWAVYVHTPVGLINWDMFIYLPLQNYPRAGFGGGLQLIGDWAYVHE